MIIRQHLQPKVRNQIYDGGLLYHIDAGVDDPGCEREGDTFRLARLLRAESSQNRVGRLEWDSVGSIQSKIVLLKRSPLPLSCGECGGPIEC